MSPLPPTWPPTTGRQALVADPELRPGFRRHEAVLLLIAAAFTSAGLALAVVDDGSAVDASFAIRESSVAGCRLPMTPGVTVKQGIGGPWQSPAAASTLR